jgi:hypothetical protein
MPTNLISALGNIHNDMWLIAVARQLPAIPVLSNRLVTMAAKTCHKTGNASDASRAQVPSKLAGARLPSGEVQVEQSGPLQRAFVFELHLVA